MYDLLSFEVASIILGFHIEGNAERIDLSATDRRFLSDQPADCRFDVYFGLSGKRSPEATIFETHQPWRIAQGADSLIVQVDAYRGRPAVRGAFAPDFASGSIYYSTMGASADHLPSPLKWPLGRVLMTSRLSRGFGVMVHAAGIRAGKRGFLFAGTDGIGKSTMAHLWSSQGAGITIGDDHIAIRKHRGRFWMYSTPWQGGEFTVDAVPIDGVFVLHQGTENQLQQLRPVEGTANVLARSFPPFWLAEGMQFTVDLLSELCSTVPVYDLTFKPDPNVVEFVECAINR